MEHLIHHWINWKSQANWNPPSQNFHYHLAFEFFLYEKNRLIWELITDEDRKDKMYIVKLLNKYK